MDPIDRFPRATPPSREWEEQPDDGFIGHVGPLWQHRERGLGRYAILPDERHRNWRGVVQGGMLMTLADRAMGSAAREDDPSVKQATAQLDVHFLAPARLGVLLEASCKVVHRTRSLIFMHGVLTQDDNVVATASGVWKAFRPRPESPATEGDAPATLPGGMRDWTELPDDGFLAHAGPMLRHGDGGHRYAFLADARHRNRRGVVQGGMLMTLADRGMGEAARDDAPDIAPATVQLNMSFVAPSRIGGIVEADCSIVSRTRSLVFVQSVLSQAGTVVATASGIWRPKPRVAEG